MARPCFAHASRLASACLVGVLAWPVLAAAQAAAIPDPVDQAAEAHRVETNDGATRHYSQLLAFAHAPADPLSDGVLAEQLRAAVRWSGDDDESATVKDLRRQVMAEIGVVDARLAPRLIDDAAVLALRLGPLRRDEDTPAQRAAWAARLEELDPDNLYAVFKLVDRAAGERDAAATSHALLLGIHAVRYDDHRLALARAMHARRLAVPADLRPRELPIALDPVAMPMLDLMDNSALCRRGNAGVHRICTLLYTRVFEQARDLQTARVATIVLAATGDEDVQAQARVDRRRLDWLQAKLGEWMLGGMPGGEEYVRDVLAEGSLHAVRRLLQRRGVALEPPDDWVDPDDTEAQDAPAEDENG
jgi:hypothetical protein